MAAGAGDASLLGLLVGGSTTPAAEAARQRRDALYAFQGATVQCVRAPRAACGTPDVIVSRASRRR